MDILSSIVDRSIRFSCPNYSGQLLISQLMQL